MVTLNRISASLKQTVSAKQFNKIAKSNPGIIKRSTFIPPRIGRENDFGNFEVEYYYGSKR